MNTPAMVEQTDMKHNNAESHTLSYATVSNATIMCA